MMPHVKIFFGKVLPNLKVWWTMTAMVITMTFLLLHVRFQITNGSNIYHNLSDGSTDMLILMADICLYIEWNAYFTYIN